MKNILQSIFIYSLSIYSLNEIIISFFPKFAMINRYQPRTTRSYLNKQQLVSSYENSLSSLSPLQTCFIRSRSTFQFPVHICSNRGPVYQRDEEEEEEEEASYSFALHASTTWSRYRFPYIPSPGNTYREFKCLRWLDGWTAGRGLACFDGGKLASLADRVSRG